MLDVSLDEKKNKHALVLALHDSIYIFTDLTNEKTSDHGAYEYKHSNEITSYVYLSGRDWLVFTDLSKKLFVIDRATKSVLTTKNIAKKAAKLIANSSETVLVLADKTGNVLSLSVEPQELDTSEFKLMMGHLSMITDLKLSANERFVITADRDEKIRLSCFPNSYNIEAYLLGHKEFVSQIVLVGDKRLISSSGDSNVILWSLDNYKCVTKIDLLELTQKTGQADNNNKESENVKGIDRIDYESTSQRLLVHMFQASELLCFNYSSEEEKLVFAARIPCLDREITMFAHLSADYYLLVALSDQSTHADNQFIVKKWTENNLVDIDGNDRFKALERYMCDKIRIENVSQVKSEAHKEYTSYFKAKVNNMTYYYDKKQERINNTSSGKKRKNSNSSSSQAVAESAPQAKLVVK